MRKANGIITGKPFSLHRRGRVWYAQFKTPAGVWTTARSTRQTSRNRAEAWCVQRLVEGDIITLENITLDQWSRNFFDWDGPWTINRRAAGKRASMRNCLEQARVLTNRILPTLGGLRLADIDTLTIREFRNNLYRNGMSASSINKALGVLRNLLTAADEQGLIRKMPRIEASSGRPRYRGILSVDEARAIFN
ncbi:MAG: phage integrase SAM-like domain-containing protein, partial [Spirochaetota bacterium]|nr:phage integrase SAM-like domain-containing protein [Spirochaetota bacterium]